MRLGAVKPALTPSWRYDVRDLLDQHNVEKIERRTLISSVTTYCSRKLRSPHLRHVLLSYMSYYNDTRTHLSVIVQGCTGLARGWEGSETLSPSRSLGGLHHQCARI